MSSRVWESAVINAPIDKVWDAVRVFNFAFNPNVASAEVEEKKSPSEVGAVVVVKYKDGTTQRLRITEVSDINRSVSWEMIESAPAIPVLSVNHTITLRRITENNQTFIEWNVHFSKDASDDVIQDARYKAKDNFAALQKSVAEGERGGKVGMIYDPAKARAGVLGVWADLQALNNETSNTTLGIEELKSAVEKYKQFPITWQINWEIAGLSAATAQEIADAVRDRLNEAQVSLGSNALPLPRLFNADAQ